MAQLLLATVIALLNRLKSVDLAENLDVVGMQALSVLKQDSIYAVHVVLDSIASLKHRLHVQFDTLSRKLICLQPMNKLLKHPSRTRGLAFALCLCFAALSLQPSEAQARNQRGYVKKNGTYVQPHQKMNPDGKRYNNRGSRTNGGSQRDEFSNPPQHNKRR